MTYIQSLVARITVLVGATIALLLGLDVISWTNTQTGTVSGAALAGIALVVSLIAHFRPNTAKEPVAVAASFTAALVALFALGNAFAWWQLAASTENVILLFVAAVIGVGTALKARSVVFPTTSK